MRHYGSRGRINLILDILGHAGGASSLDAQSREVMDGIFTCLHCGACDTQCPASIKISDVILSFKALVLAQRLKGDDSR
jgi:glycolate oxidase iron-sulfur subunit